MEAAGCRLVRTKLYVGDYRLVGGTRCVDTKASLQEAASNIDQQHERFRRELIRAREAGYELVILVENAHGVRSLADLAAWTEPDGEFRRRRGAVRRLDGARLAKAMATMAGRYGVSWAFCAPAAAGRAVIEILRGEGAWLDRS